MTHHRRKATRFALALALAAATFAGPAKAADPYEINAILPQTGTAAALGKSFAVSLGVLETVTNKAGGIAGRPIKFVIQDDQSNPQITLQITNGLIAKQVPIVIGPTLTATCSAIAPLLKDGPVDMCTSPGLHPPPGSFSFSATPSTLDITTVTARYAEHKGWKKVAFIITTDSSGQDGERALTQAFAEFKDISVVDIEHFGATDLSVTAQLSRIKAAGAEALDIWATGTAAGTALRDAHDLAFDIPILASYSNATWAQMDAYKSFLPKDLLFAAPPTMAGNELPRGQLRDTVQQFYAAFRAAGIKPEVGNPGAWEAGLLAINAFKHLGLNATAAQMREYLAQLKGHTGVVGTYDFRAIPQRGIDWKSSILMTRWDPAKGMWVGISPLGG